MALFYNEAWRPSDAHARWKAAVTRMGLEGSSLLRAALEAGLADALVAGEGGSMHDRGVVRSHKEGPCLAAGASERIRGARSPSEGIVLASCH